MHTPTPMLPGVTTAEIAQRYGVTPRRILAIAQRRGIAPSVRVGRVCLWARSSVRGLKPGKPGRPRVDA